MVTETIKPEPVRPNNAPSPAIRAIFAGGFNEILTKFV